MKKAIFRLIIFAGLFLLIDFVAGRVLHAMQLSVKGGTIGKLNYIAEEATQDIVVFGSSKGESNYNPQVFEDSLGMSCYNCARNSNGIILMYGRYKMLTERYTPKVIIYDIKPQFDYYKGDNSKYLTFLKPFYDKNGVDSLIWSIDGKERVKMMSGLYRYNYQFLEILASMRAGGDTGNGYAAGNKVMGVIPYKAEPSVQTEFDELKLKYLEDMIVDAKSRGIQLLFVVSPEYFVYQNYTYEPVEKLCLQYDIPFFNDSKDEEIVGDTRYFQDSLHMNYKGACTFSAKVASLLKNMLSNS